MRLNARFSDDTAGQKKSTPDLIEHNEFAFWIFLDFILGVLLNVSNLT